MSSSSSISSTLRRLQSTIDCKSEQKTRSELERKLLEMNWRDDQILHDHDATLQASKSDGVIFASKSKGGRPGAPDVVLFGGCQKRALVVMECKSRRADVGAAAEEAKAYAQVFFNKFEFKPVLVCGIAGSGPTFTSWTYKKINQSWERICEGDKPIDRVLAEAEVKVLLDPAHAAVCDLDKCLATNQKTGDKAMLSREQQQKDLHRIFTKVGDILKTAGVSGPEKVTHDFSTLLFVRVWDDGNLWSKLQAETNQAGRLEFFVQVLLPKLNKLYPSPKGTNGPVFEFSLGQQDYSNNSAAFNELYQLLTTCNFDHYDCDIRGEAFEHYVESQGRKNKLFGEFYTPRDIVRFVVDYLNPKFGDTAFDPFCGTGGFLTVVFEKIRASMTAEDDVGILKRSSIFGSEINPETARLTFCNMILREWPLGSRVDSRSRQAATDRVASSGKTRS